MSTMGEQRPKIEECAAAYIPTGAVMVDDNGVDWIVTVGDSGEEGKTRLDLHRVVRDAKHGDKTYRTGMTVSDSLHLRIRNEDYL